MLWGAAGLLVERGSPGAHLFEVARALGVPAVIGPLLEVGEGDLVAVDGTTGLVHVAPRTTGQEATTAS